MFQDYQFIDLVAEVVNKGFLVWNFIDTWHDMAVSSNEI